MSLSLFQRVKDYFIQRDLITPEYILTECGKHLSRDQLNRYFNRKIRKHDVHKFRLLFNQQCTSKLAAYAEATRQGGDFWKLVQTVIKTEQIFYFNSTIKWVQRLETFLNVIWYLGSLYFPWSTYLLFYPGGKRMLKDMFSKPSMEGLLSLYCIIYTIQTRKEYDDLFFQEEIVRLIPHLNLPRGIMLKLGFPENPTETSWYQYITLNLVSDKSIKNVSSLLDSKLTTYVLTELLVYIQQLIEESGSGQFLTDLLVSINEQALPAKTARSTSTVRIITSSRSFSA
jgi:hypothetical protein